MRTLILLLAIVIMALGSPANADDNAAIARSVIRSQDEAVSRDDATTAYSFAAPSIQSQYRTADLFMWMVREGYAPVFRHQHFEFGETRALENGNLTQDVHIIDADGVAWEALYTLEQQTDGTWKINGCHLSKAVSA